MKGDCGSSITIVSSEIRERPRMVRDGDDSFTVNAYIYIYMFMAYDRSDAG